MRNRAKQISAVVSRVLFIGLTFQMLLGLFWLLCNFGFFQEYEESFFLLKVSETLICDEYTGILYPILINVARGTAGVIPVPYYCFLYLLQLVAAFFSGYFLMGSCGLFPEDSTAGKDEKEQGKKIKIYRIWAGLVCVCIPVVLQCHLAVLPVSLTVSLLLVQLGIVLRGGISPDKKGGKRPVLSVTVMGVLWLLECLLMPEYELFGALLMGVFAVLQLFGKTGRNLKTAAGPVLATAAFLGLVPLLAGMTVQEGAYGRMEKSMESALMRRTTGSCLGVLYSDWPEDMKNCLSEEDMEELLNGAGGMQRVLGSRVEGTYGRERAREIYREMAATGWRRNFREVRKETAMDLLGYGFAPLFLNLYLQSDYYVSYIPQNYEVMRMHAPEITRAALWYGGCWFAAGILLAGVCQLLYWGIASDPAGRKKEIITGVLLTVFCAGICLWYSLQGYGVMDYKNSSVVTVLWTVWMCCCVIKGMKQVE